MFAENILNPYPYANIDECCGFNSFPNDKLTLSQTTYFRLFQSERVCR